MCVNALCKLLHKIQMLLISTTGLTECEILESGFLGIIEVSVPIFLFQLEWKHIFRMFSNPGTSPSNLPTCSRKHLLPDNKTEN